MKENLQCYVSYTNYKQFHGLCIYLLIHLYLNIELILLFEVILLCVKHTDTRFWKRYIDVKYTSWSRNSYAASIICIERHVIANMILKLWNYLIFVILSHNAVTILI